MGKICGTLALALVACTEQPKIKLATSREAISGVNWLMFHGDRERSGWNPNETLLTPANVGGGNFGVLWDMTAPLDGDASGNPPHLYAAPLYVDTVVMTTPDLAGLPFSVVQRLAVTTASFRGFTERRRLTSIPIHPGCTWPRIRTWCQREGNGACSRSISPMAT